MFCWLKKLNHLSVSWPAFSHQSRNLSTKTPQNVLIRVTGFFKSVKKIQTFSYLKIRLRTVEGKSTVFKKNTRFIGQFSKREPFASRVARQSRAAARRLRQWEPAVWRHWERGRERETGEGGAAGTSRRARGAPINLLLPWQTNGVSVLPSRTQSHVGKMLFSPNLIFRLNNWEWYLPYILLKYLDSNKKQDDHQKTL